MRRTALLLPRNVAARVLPARPSGSTLQAVRGLSVASSGSRGAWIRDGGSSAKRLFVPGRRALSDGAPVPPTAPPADQGPPPEKLFEVESATFVKEVLESVDPVIVFACAPQQQEMVAALAQAVQATPGIRLALMDAQKCSDIAQQLRIENLPTALAFTGGKCVDMQPGEMTAGSAGEYVQRVLGLTKTKAATDAMQVAGKALSQGQVEVALNIYMQVQTQSRETHGGPATAGMALCAIQLKDMDAARDLAETIRRDFASDLEDPIVKQALNAVEFAEMGASGDSDLGELEAKVAGDPEDHQARHDLSLALFGAKRYEEAIKEGLEIVKRDKAWEGGKAKDLLFKFFDTLGSQHPLVSDARKRMASLLF